MNIYPVIMAGGIGSRFWPRSRQKTPKQFLKILSEEFTMIQLARNLLIDFVPTENIYILTNESLQEAVTQQLPDIKKENILIEPAARDTAPCIALAAATLAQRDPNAIMLIMPCDHWIQPKEKFHQAIRLAAELAQQKETLITLGVKPSYPATCYGYIEKSANGIIKNNLPVFPVATFKEKPDKETAQKFIDSQNFFWNSGIFIWQAKVILDRIKEIMPTLYEGVQAIVKSNYKNIAQIYPQLPKISIDFGIMEKVKDIQVVGVDYIWDDIGNWESLTGYLPINDQKNLLQGEVVLIDSHHNIIINDDTSLLIAGAHLENFLIVKSGNALLITPRQKGQDIKKLITELTEKNKKSFL